VGRLRDATGRDIRIEAGSDLIGLPSVVTVACFRIIQEALSNALKHSAAERIDVRASRVGGLVRIAIVDNGKGFDVAKAHARACRAGGIGLLTMRERVALAGGSFAINSTPGHGTQIHVGIPLGGADSLASPVANAASAVGAGAP